MEAWLTHINHWDWGIAAVALLLLEVTAPAFFFLWLGLAAGVVAVVAYLFPAMGWKWEMLLFSALSLLAVTLWHLVLRKKPTQTDQPTLNRRGSHYIGRSFALDEAIVHGIGKIRVGDTVWKVSGPDLAVGATVRVVASEGTILKVEAA